jgi:hypothetical protein
MTDALLDAPSVLHVGEMLWGIVLIAVTMAIHALGMPATRLLAGRLWRLWPPGRGVYSGVPILVLASWVIVAVHLLEVVVWSGFLLWREAEANAADAFYFTLCQYVTVGSDLALPDRWRLVGGMISMAGLLTFAWSTAVLLTLEQRFDDAKIAARSPRAASAPGAKETSDDH